MAITSARRATGFAPSRKRSRRAPGGSGSWRIRCTSEGARGRPPVTVTHNTALNRYEMKTEHGRALAVYYQQGGGVVFTHTEGRIEDEGRGYASQLVKVPLEDTSAA